MRREVILLLSAILLAGCASTARNRMKVEEDMEWAHFWYSRGDFEKAVKKFQDALSKNPELVEAHIGLANSRREWGKLRFRSKDRNAIDAEHNLAIISFMNALKIDPNNISAFYGLGLLYYERATTLEEGIFTADEQKYYRDECIKYFEKVVAKEPRNFTAHRYLGIAYAMIPDKKKSLEHLNCFLAYLDANIANLKNIPQPTEEIKNQLSRFEREASDIREIIRSLEELQ